ncbi:DUF1657 domain-containing protein [Oceanobacillus salinisoli]|uniref:DUF1657 domain-containing protein n=1 Tax=Oceanobacillus salinisoli TaxID=2678611 RepID=UPI0012E30DE4|nr:DUF1657 domain-containing protein [Oceanobacillus salinisoli]
MTVINQVQQALANAKSAQASFESYSLKTQDESAKEMYINAAGQLQTIIDGLENRLKEIERDEPSYLK